MTPARAILLLVSALSIPALFAYLNRRWFRSAGFGQAYLLNLPGCFVFILLKAAAFSTGHRVFEVLAPLAMLIGIYVPIRILQRRSGRPS